MFPHNRKILYFISSTAKGRLRCSLSNVRLLHLSHSPLKAYMEPFFSCMKESKGLPLQATASGSGASVVAVVTGTVVVSAVASVWGGLVVLGSFSVGGTVGVSCTKGIFWNMVSISRGVLVIFSVVSGWCCGLRPKSEMGCCVGLSWRLMAVKCCCAERPGGGVVPSNCSSSSSANTNVSPRAERGGWHKSDINDHPSLQHFDSQHDCVSNTRAERLSYSSCRRWRRSRSSSSCNTCTSSHTGTSSEIQSHSHSDPCTTLKIQWESLRKWIVSIVLVVLVDVCVFSANESPPLDNEVKLDLIWLQLPWGFGSMPIAQTHGICCSLLLIILFFYHCS